jgi:ribonucleoside-diphosphate reductase alpha chain
MSSQPFSTILRQTVTFLRLIPIGDNASLIA